jgi:hypothetical protein
MVERNVTLAMISSIIESPHFKVKQGPKLILAKSFSGSLDFAAIKLAPGIEAKSYIKDGALFSEDAKGNIMEVQILNTRSNQKQKSKKSRSAV